MGYPPLKGRLHTRYSPVRRSPPEVLPLDLHVLGLSLAFILSQDQTLRCKFFFFFIQPQVFPDCCLFILLELNGKALSPCSTHSNSTTCYSVCNQFQLFKDHCKPERYFRIAGAKIAVIFQPTKHSCQKLQIFTEF